MRTAKEIIEDHLDPRSEWHSPQSFAIKGHIVIEIIEDAQREALEEAAKICSVPRDMSTWMCMKAIRDLIPKEPSNGS